MKRTKTNTSIEFSNKTVVFNTNIIKNQFLKR